MITNKPVPKIITSSMTFLRVNFKSLGKSAVTFNARNFEDTGPIRNGDFVIK